MSTTVSAYLVTTVGITVLTIGGFIGLVYRSTDSHNGNTTDSGAASQDQTTVNESVADTGVNSLNHTTLNEKLKKQIEDVVKREVEDVVKSEFEEYRKKSEETHDLQIYKKGEVEQVLTPELLYEVIEDKVTQVFDKYKDKIEDLEKKLDLKNEDRQISKPAENDYLERLQKLESIMQEKEKDSNPGVKYVENIYDILSLTASRIKELYNIALSQAYSSLPNITSEAVIEYSQQNASAGQSVVVTTTTVFFILGILELCCCFCICKRCCRRNRDTESKPSTNSSSGSSKTGPSSSSSSSSKEELKIAYKKLDNSLCVISFSKDYVTKYHLPLARSLTEYMSLGKLHNMKHVIITKPENLNSIPRSSVFIVCVDYNERNDILEPDTTNKNNFLVRRSTVCSLMDSEALVILVYCLEKSSENLSVSDRYAHKLHSKIVAVEETRELDQKNCIFSVYKTFSVFQLGAMKQTVSEFLKKVEEIVSR